MSSVVIMMMTNNLSTKTKLERVKNTNTHELIKVMQSELTFICAVKCGDPLSAVHEEIYSSSSMIRFGFYVFIYPMKKVVLTGTKILSIICRLIKGPQTHHCSIKFLQLTANYSLEYMKLYNHRIA